MLPLKGKKRTLTGRMPVLSKQLSLVCLCAMVGWSASANAAVIANACNTCNEAQYEGVAIQTAQSMNQGQGYQYVYDLAHGVLVKYAVEREPKYGGWAYTVTPTAPSAAEAKAFSASAKALRANGGSSTFFWHIQQSDAGFPVPNASVYDVLWTSAYQNAIGNFVSGATNFRVLDDVGMTVAALFGDASVVTLKQNPFLVTVTAVMNSGAKMLLKWQAGEPQYHVASAQDVNRNTIPLAVTDLNGNRYVFSRGGGDKFSQYLGDRFGGAVSLLGKVCVNGTLACTSAGDPKSKVVTSCQWISCATPSP